ncbi:MAG: hypothetical protein ACSLFL_05240, partial [Alphaproteobacteria bacterium]
VAFAVGSSLSLEEIVAAKDYSLAAAAEPAFGPYGFYFTIARAVGDTAGCERVRAGLVGDYIKIIGYA